jgi:hypothetical protein
VIPHAKVRNALRKLWLWGDDRKAALKAARVFRGYYVCSICRLPTKEPEVDHVVPVGGTPGARGATSDWNGFMQRLFCDAVGLQVLCPICHAAKTRGRATECA